MIDFTPIISYLSQRPDITFAHVFGSVLTEYFIEGKSDIDLAIMGADNELVHDLFYCTQSSKFIDHQAWSKQFDDVLREGILTKSDPQ